MSCIESESLAPQACAACKKRKGKCDRVRPSCSFCNSKMIYCQYFNCTSVTGPTKTPMRQLAKFPFAFFLDQELFSVSPVKFPLIGYGAPDYVALEIGDISQKMLIASQFFDTVHIWMPIVSKSQFFTALANPIASLNSDLDLLCLSMKLVMVTPPTHDVATNISTYHATRRFLHSVEISRSLTLSTLQAAIFVAVYEIGHGIYPAANASIAHCAQYAIAIGLGWGATSPKDDQVCWIASEERRRVWWAVVILERYACLGWPKRSVLSEAPQANSLLPCDDLAWDQGVKVTNFAMTSSDPKDLNMNAFSLLAQATYLLDQVIRHVRDPAVTAQDESTIRLDMALCSLAAFTATESSRRHSKVCCYTALCHSAMALLHKNCGYQQEAASLSQDYVFRLATKTRRRVAVEFLAESEMELNGDDRRLQLASPLILHWGYEALAYFADSVRNESNTDADVALGAARKAMERLNLRWKAADIYLNMLEARQQMLGTIAA